MTCGVVFFFFLVRSVKPLQVAIAHPKGGDGQDRTQEMPKHLSPTPLFLFSSQYSRDAPPRYRPPIHQPTSTNMRYSKYVWVLLFVPRNTRRVIVCASIRAGTSSNNRAFGTCPRIVADEATTKARSAATAIIWWTAAGFPQSRNTSSSSANEDSRTARRTTSPPTALLTGLVQPLRRRQSWEKQ